MRCIEQKQFAVELTLPELLALLALMEPPTPKIPITARMVVMSVRSGNKVERVLRVLWTDEREQPAEGRP